MSLRLLVAAQLLFPGGPWFAEDVPRRPGGTWLALYDGPRPRLAAVTVRASRMRHPIVDEENEPPTGWGFKVPGEPVCMVRGEASLTAGPVAKAAVEAGELVTAPRAVRLGGHTWRLVPERMERHALAGGSVTYTDGRLVLTDGTTRQILIDLAGQGEVFGTTWYVSFAGDLDRDGKPDLLMGLKYNLVGSREVLFLSGAAGKGKLVREAAEFVGGGC